MQDPRATITKRHRLAAAFVVGSILSCFGGLCPAPAAQGKVAIAAAISLTGEASSFGVGSLDGIKLAIEEANSSGEGPWIELKVYDNRSSLEASKEIVKQVIASPAALLIGPSISSISIAVGPTLAEAGLPAISTTATSDLITKNATTFRTLFKNSEQGEMLATYLHQVLGWRSAALLVMDDGYGRTLEGGFRSAAERLGIDTRYYVIKSREQVEEVAGAAAAEIADRPVVLAMLDFEGAKAVKVLRRSGVKGPYLGGDAFGVESFNSAFADLPEEKKQPGYFSEGLYGITPMLLDSANAEMLSFAERFKERFGHNPGWTAVAGYDATKLAIEAVGALPAEARAGDRNTQRAAILQALAGFNDPARARMGLLGPLAFDAERGRPTAIRIGHFNRGRFESAPLQIVSVVAPHETEIKSGAVFEIRPGSYARLQQVIYSGLYVNEITWMDQIHSSFSADFYVWLRFARNSGPEAADPTEIKFPDLSNGRFDREHPVEQREMADGTSYVLWRVQGEFHNNFDFHRYPFDRQTLTLRFVNSRAAADRIVYALDQSSSQGLGDTAPQQTSSGASAVAFHGLSQWRFLGIHQRRDSFVARSSLGDPRRVGRENFRELSGYATTIDLERRWRSNLTKNLLPLLLMTGIMYASLHFPPVLVQVKVGVAMTGFLTGMVLLTSINSQLGPIGYTVAVEYAFYLFFALGLLHIVSVLLGEHFRAAGRISTARRTDFWARGLFLAGVFGLFVAALIYQ